VEVSTALLIAAAASTAAAAVSGMASYAGAGAQAAAADFDSEMAQENARLAQQEAGDAEALQRRQARAALSEQRSTAAERGLLLTGSAWDLYRQAAIDAEEDALLVRRQGALRARGLLVQSAVSRSEAGSFRTGARIGAGAAILSGGAAAAQGYGTYRYHQAGQGAG
jgi:hypothetical protein